MTWDMYDVLVRNWANGGPIIMPPDEASIYGRLIQPYQVNRVAGMYEISQKGKEILASYITDDQLKLLVQCYNYNLVLYGNDPAIDHATSLFMLGMIESKRTTAELQITRRGRFTVRAMYAKLYTNPEECHLLQGFQI